MESITVPVGSDRLRATLWPDLTQAEISHLSDLYELEYREYCEICNGRPILPQRLWCCVYARFELLSEQQIKILKSYLDVDMTTEGAAERNSLTVVEVKESLREIGMLFGNRKIQTVTALLTWARIFVPQFDADIDLEPLNNPSSSVAGGDRYPIDFNAFRQQQERSGMTTLDLWRERHQKGELMIGYSTFTRKYRAWKKTNSFVFGGDRVPA